jgi:ubiquinone/menaquinone biosynthesis C-methylase UbiE
MTTMPTHPERGYDTRPPVNYERYFVSAIGAPLAADLVDAAALQPGERVLDMACGTGVVARLAAERVGAGGTVTGVDVNPGMLAVARSGGAAVEWHEADGTDTGLPGAHYDAVLCQLGLQFFANRTAALQEMRRLLAPGGRMAVNVPGPTPAMFGVLERGLAEHVSAAAASFVATVFSISEISEIERLFDQAGIGEITVERSAMRLGLPSPADFLWQYVSSTPLAPAVAGVDEQSRAALEAEVTAQWKAFVGDGGSLILDVDVLTATGRRSPC